MIYLITYCLAVYCSPILNQPVPGLRGLGCGRADLQPNETKYISELLRFENHLTYLSNKTYVVSTPKEPSL